MALSSRPGRSNSKAVSLSSPSSSHLAPPTAANNARRRPSSTERQQREELRQQVLRKPRNYLEAALLLACAVTVIARIASLPWPFASALAAETCVPVAFALLLIAFKKPGEFCAIWATDLRAFRPSLEDGAVFGLLMGPTVAATLLLIAAQQVQPTSHLFPGGEPVPYPSWRIEPPPPLLASSPPPLPLGTSSLLLSRCGLLNMQNLISTIFFAHILAARYIRRPDQIPRRTSAKFRSFTLFSLLLVGLLSGVQTMARRFGIPLWTELATWEFISIAFLYQVDLFIVTRLARRNFTIGELGIVAQLGAIIALEAIHLTAAKLWPATTPFLKTYRHPTPLVIFQLALTAGAFLVGFLLSPILYLSRHLAQKPTHRLRWPEKRNFHRRLLSVSFYILAAIYILGVLGLWVRWLLVKRDPWVWTLRFLLKGAYPFSRFALVAYWTSLIGASVFSWQVINSTVRRTKPQTISSSPTLSSNGFEKRSNGTSSLHAVKEAAAAAIGAGLQHSSTSNGNSNGNHLSHQKDSPSNSAAIRKAVYMSLNARRKFFHFLAVLLFVPGILWDPALMHLAFSLAFSLFIFMEYVRYFALLPFGASLHVFLAQFLDSKDSGPVILSHFYLLSGCAASLWLEGPGPIYDVMGVLVLGVGDALASILGKKLGKRHWPGSSKTWEGSATFVVSIVLCGWLLRIAGFVPYFNLPKFALASIATALMEGASEQNDNLILPLFAFVVMYVLQV
ncbi:dolichol kinase [Tilletia horrida]|uniref:dolichol kinase n=1 Tax=Tilletia horrida TaxID=155126 RepID=A0AAN6GNR3_9BASI|nr:dolichol kinase [Tilletia horrida]KAK0550450.1 dolichol kinase [Tilletia horrida]KAK0564118.1 dolichol kinase [Tilletia horrida]